MKQLKKHHKVLIAVLLLLILLSCAATYFFFDNVNRTFGVLLILFSWVVGFLIVWYIFQELRYQFSSGGAQRAFNELSFGSQPRNVAITFGFSLLVILFLPIVLTRHTLFESLAFNETGPIGDTFGGIMGPFIAILAAWLAYKAFLMQYEANQQIKKDSEISRFETNFFQLLALQQKITEDLILYTEVMEDQKKVEELLADQGLTQERIQAFGQQMAKASFKHNSIDRYPAHT